jgi:hypothetical protein
MSPNTIGVLLLFLVVFLACILWATRGDTPDTHRDEGDYGAVGKHS